MRGAAGVLAALGIAAAPTAASDALRPADFATGRTLEASGSDPLQTLLLDLLVYRGSVGPALADLRVFNAKGQGVPHAIRSLAHPSAAPPASVPVPVFRLPRARGGEAEGYVGDRGRPWRSLGVEVEIGTDGAILRVEPGRTPGQPTPALLVDLSRLPREAVGLELEFAAEPAEFLIPVRVEVSDDLVHFRERRTRSALARLEQGGHRIERSDVSFRAAGRRYLVLSADGPLPEIRSARARLAPAAAPPPRHEVSLVGVAQDGLPGVFLFDTGGAVPVDRVQVALPQPNTVVRAELFSASGAEGRWTRRRADLFYRLERTPPLRNDPVSLAPTRDRWWKLVVSPEGGGLGGGAPALEVSWHPEQLLFVQRGPAPFALGYGRADTLGGRFSASELLRTIGATPGDVPRETASLGPPRPVGDPSVLDPRREPVPPRTYALWAFLVVVVASVLGLSLRLLRQIRSGDGVPPP